jgi:NTP pyrophosphatase (non-canonical NTP hydrolase)
MKIVLGTGVNGLIWAAFNPDYTAIGLKHGGDFVSAAAVLLMSSTPETQAMLQDLGVPYTVRTYHHRFYLNGKELSEAPPELSMKKSGRTSDCHRGKPTRMNTVKHIAVLDFDPEVLVAKLLKRCKGRVITDEICRITDDEVICRATAYRYTRLVSTLPAPVFWKLRQMQPPGGELSSSPTAFALCEYGPGDAGACGPGDSAYYAGDDVPFVRVSCQRVGEWLYEFPGGVVPSAWADGCKASWVNHMAVIHDNKRNVPPPDTLFLGRMAAWDHSLLFQDVARVAMQDCDLRFAWERQRHFEARVFDLNSDLDTESVSKSLVTALIAECAEVLDELNYKTHANEHEVDAQALRLELIDVFKYTMALCQFWGVDAAQFLSDFDTKSKIIEEKYDAAIRQRCTLPS